MTEETVKIIEGNKFLKKLYSLYTIGSEKALLIRKIWLPCIAIIYVVISFFVVEHIFGCDNFSDGISLLINIDLALFALQIATFTLILSPYKNLQNQMKRRKSIYIREIVKDKSLFDTQILKKFDETISFNNRKFRFETYCISVILINFIISLIIGCTTFAGTQVRISFLFANMINQLVAFIHFLLMLCSFFLESKKEVKEDMAFDVDYLTNKIKATDTHKTNKERHEICCKIERIAREEENNG